MKKLCLMLSVALLANFAKAQVVNPPGENALGKDSIEAYRLNGSDCSATQIPIEGQYFTEAFDIVIDKAPEKVHQTSLSASNAIPISKGDVLFMRWSARSDADGGAKGQLFVQSSKEWSKSLANQIFTVDKNWQTWATFFVAPDDYLIGTLYFNIFLGHQAQKLQIGGIEVINCGKEKSVDELRKAIPRIPSFQTSKKNSGKCR